MLRLKDIKKELTKAQVKYKVEYDKEKQMYQKMLRSISVFLMKNMRLEIIPIII